MPITTILVGCDLSDGSDTAIDRALVIAGQHGAHVVLVHAQADDAPIENVDNEMLQQIGEVTAAVRLEEARGLADRLAVLQGRGITAEAVSRSGPPGEVMAAVATERAAELIVVGTHGRTGLSRFLIGSQATEVVRHAPCDVLVCRGPAAKHPFQRLLVASDFSPAAAKAVEHGAQLTAPGALVEVVHAWQLPAGSWGATLLGQARFPWSTVRDAVLASAKAQADKVIAGAADLGHPIHVELVQGSPSAVITQTAERGNHDLIAVGAHGHRGVRRLLLGSVAESTIRHAPCSVLVVHA